MTINAPSTAGLWAGVSSNYGKNEPALSLPPTSTAIAHEARVVRSHRVATAPCYALDRATVLDRTGFPNPPTKGHGPKATIPNVAYLLKEYGIAVRYNEVKKKLDISMPGHSEPSDNFDNAAIAQIESLARLNGMSTSPVAGIVSALGDRNLYNPVAEWIESEAWDGLDRMPAFFATLREADGYPRSLKETQMYRWMVSAVAAIFSETGFDCRGVLTLQGAQGIGKTKWASALVPDAVLRRQVVKLGQHLDAGDKDSQLAALTHWIVEIGELDGSLRRDIARLKGFLTLDQDKIRRPYARTESEYPRRTVFCASVNDPNFLVDPTGNSRWWTLSLSSIDYEHNVDMQQVFAQLLVDFRSGAAWWLTREEEAVLAAQNAGYRTESVIRERVLGILDLSLVGDPKLKATRSVEVLAAIGIKEPTNPQMKECVGVLRELLGEGTRIRGQQKWRVPFADLSSVSLGAEDDVPFFVTSPASKSMEDDLPW